MGKRLATGIAGSRLAVIVTTAIITTIVIAGGIAAATVAINSVGSAEIIDGSIRSSDIANGTIRSGDIANGTIRSGDIANGTIRSGDITDGTIRSGDITDGTIRSTDITDGTITSTDLADGTITRGDLAAGAKPAGVNFADGNQLLALTLDPQSVRDVVLDAPAAGYVIVTASGYTLFGSTGYEQVVCSITDGAIDTDFDHAMAADDSGINASTQLIPLSGTRTFAVPAGPTTFRLVCRETSGTVSFSDSQITALYVPTLYAP